VFGLSLDRQTGHLRGRRGHGATTVMAADNAGE
jgi:hypothetical protein